VETITTRFNGTTYGTADSVDGREINDMPNERIKDLIQILVTVETKIQSCDIAPTGSNDPDRKTKKKDHHAQAFQHLTFLMKLVTLGISHLLVATEKFPHNQLVYTDNAKAYMLKAGIDKYPFSRFTTRTQGVDSLRSTKVKTDASYTKCMVWFINIYVSWVLALTKIPLHTIKSHEFRPAQTINRDMIPKLLAWFQALIKKGTQRADENSKRGSVTFYTPKGNLKPWAQFLPILNIACNVPEVAEYRTTLLAQKHQEPTGGTRKRTEKEKDRRARNNLKSSQRRILEDSCSDSDDTY
jgi:hypothetical protein